ncbi:MAG TPA: EAL domain-containing protein [Steroidobacteraceae bacterium]|jgi:diguanylate cyclase (GGDEF)-like protein/PAS domain S-box-containing protein|nr:EAL domain-containing protein [Steroidobacteraceae bacterium]
MPTLEILTLALGLVAAGALALYLRKRRESRALDALNADLERIAKEGRVDERVVADSDQPRVASAAQSVNQLLTRLETRSKKNQDQDLLYNRLVEAVHEAVVLHRDTIVHANTRFAALTGLSAQELKGRKLDELVPSDYADLVRENLRRMLAGEPAAQRYEIELVGAQGQVSRLELAGSLIDSQGDPMLLITAVEMTPRHGSGAPEQERSRALATLQAIGEGVITTDKRGRIDYMNEAAERFTGTTAMQAIGHGLDDIVSLLNESDRQSLADPVRQCLTSGARAGLGRKALLLARGTGEEHYIELNVSPLRGPQNDVNGAVVVMHDVSEQRGLARQMSYQASHDALTGLVNRREFERRLQEALDAARAGESSHVLCYLDLDRFKAVNDSCGHLAGDNMLREVAALLKDAVRDSDTVARIGGDEFAMLLIGCPLEKARQIADDVCRAIADYRFVWKDKIFNIDVSIGLVEIGRESGSPDEVLGAADSACYVAKQQGTRVNVYSARDEAVARHRGEIHWLQKLQTALKENRFELYAQPIVPATAQVMNGPALEVLVRLKDENGQEISPGEFLRAAERYRLMSLVDRWVVQTTLAALGRGALRLAEDHSIAINISGQTLGDTQFLEFVVDCLDRTGVTPMQVCFEVTENSVITNIEHARRFIGVLHGMGCKFALDDFGRGMGSFSNLKNLTMDFLKIDGSFIRNLARDSVNQAMVTAMIKLARTLNFKVVAEQVEDEAALEAARKMGVDYVQGYLIARPQPLLAS